MKPKRGISIFTLAMINVAAVVSIRNWPAIAELGTPAIFYLLMAALFFFVPVALVSAELATGWPSNGGVFAWVKEAFGQRLGFLAVWLLWVENVPFYPMIIAFIAATLAFPINPELATNKFYNVGMILAIFWLSTLLNLLGMKISSRISMLCALIGTIFPALLIIGLGAYWITTGQPLNIDLSSFSAVIPKNVNSISSIVLFVTVVMGYMGIEMSAVHARDVENPKKNYPKAIFFSLVVILTISILGVLSLAVVLPNAGVNFAGGAIQAISLMTKIAHVGFLADWMALLIAIGAIGTLFTWTIGPSKGLLAAAMSGDLPPIFRKVNKNGMPATLLITQAFIVSILALLYVYFPVNAAYLILSAIASSLYLVMYTLLFASAIKLRYKQPKVVRSYKVPGGNLGMWLVAGAGILCSLFTMVVSLFPTDDILKTVKQISYIKVVAAGVLIGLLIPYIILLFQKPSWKNRLSHETDDF